MMNKMLAYPNAFRILIVALIGIVIVNFIDAQAEYDAIFSIDTAITILDDPLWSSDSNTFTFINLGRIQNRTQNDIFRGVELTQPLWDAYSMAILQNIQSNIWPFQPQLLIAEQGLYQPSPDGFIHTSPDGNYLVFPREKLDLTTGGARYFLTIGNRQEGTFEETSYELPIINPPHDFYTTWSENDLAFGVFHISVAGQVKILYFNIIDPSNLSSTIVHEFGDFIGEQEYITFDPTTDVLYDISDDGEKLLIAGREFLTNSDYDPYTASTHPIIWTPLESNQDRVLEQFDTNSIYDMSFAPNDESQLLLVNASGLFLYDLITNDTRILHDSFAHEELNYAAFSPDGKWLTLQVAEELRFIHIPPLLPSVACSIIIASSSTPDLISTMITANTSGTPQVLCLEEGTYTLTTSHNSGSDGANGLPVITSDITLHGLGSGATILRDSAAPAFRILKVDTGARLVLENITISGGDAGSGSGGGIRNLGTLELRDSIVENNVAADGGGIRNNNNSSSAVMLISSNSIIRNNVATDSGGGIFSNLNTSTILTGTVLSGNQANLSSGLGGGMFLNGAILSINGGAFGGNQARNGAGLFINGASQPVEITGTGFVNNAANNQGGGVYINSADVTLDGVTFTGNTSTSVGGGIRNGGTLTVIESSFSGNHGSSGGGIANFGALDLQAVQMSGNTVVVASGWGAAVFAQEAVTVNGGTFENHVARHGGAFYVDGTTIAADGAQILSNSATNRGGGVYFNGTLTGSYIHGSCLTGNSASDGNAVYSGVSTLDATGNWWGAGGASGQVNNRVDASNPLSDCTPQMQQMAAPLSMQQQSETVTTVSLPYQDNFESALNWSRSGTWSREAVGGYSEAGWVADATLRDMESVLESRVAFSIPRNRDAVVRFWQMGNLSAEDRVLLEVLPQGSQNWVVVDEQLGLQSGWTERSVVLTGYRNQAIRLRWRVISGSEESVGIEYRLDELRVETQR